MPARSKSSLTLYKKKHTKRKLSTPPPRSIRKKFRPYFSPEPMHVTPVKSSRKKLHFEEGTGNTPKDTETMTRQKSVEMQKDVKETTDLLNKLVVEGKFTVDNIGYKIFKDTLKWHSCRNTSGMRYSKETKEFFWTGERLLGGQFLRFMRGVAHKGSIKENQTEKGIYEPSDRSINFPVPSSTSLFEFKPQQAILERNPGIMTENIHLYAEHFKDKSSVIMFDGKKIVPQSAEVFLLDKEEEPKISTLKEEYDEKLEHITKFIEKLEELETKDIHTEELDVLNERSKETIKILGTSLKVLRETVAKKTMYLKNLEKKLSDTNDPKFTFPINKVKTLIYRLKICIKDILTVVDELVRFSSNCNGVYHLYCREICDLTKQANYRELKEPDEIRMTCGNDVPSHFMKQRTPEWFSLRSTAKVTGSVIHQAIGMDSLASQKQYFDQIVGGKPIKDVTGDQERAMRHGTINEENAVATLVGKILPVLYPDYIFHEEGAYEFQSSDGRRLLIISPDGSIRNEKTILSVEIKCPYSLHPGSTPVYYDVKYRHILQSLFEASVLKSHHHLYVSWSKESTTVFKVMPSDNITSAAALQVDKVYYSEVPVCPNKITQDVKTLRENVKESSRQAEFLGEFPSLTAVKSSNSNCNSPGPYILPDYSYQSNETVELTLTDTIQTLFKAQKHIKEAYEFLKPKASEVLVYLLSDMDRTWKKELGHGLPISYLFKGYSLTMNTARALLDEMLNACSRDGVHVPCTTFDGQFYRLKDFDDKDQALSLFALQRKHFAAIHKLSKSELIREISKCFKCPNWYKVNDIITENDVMIVKPGYIVLDNSLNVQPISTPLNILKKKGEQDREEPTSDTEDVQTDNELGKDVIFDDAEIISSTEEAAESRPDQHASLISEEQSVFEYSECSSSKDPKSNTVIELKEENFEIIRKHLLSGKKKAKWEHYSVADVRNMFGTANQIYKGMTGQELHDIVNYLNVLIRSRNAAPIKQSLRKAEKVNKICEIIGTKSSVIVPAKRFKPRTVCSLAGLCISEVMKQSYPKLALEAAYAKCTWPVCKAKWYEESTVEQNIKLSVVNAFVEGDKQEELSFSPVYSPEYVTARDQQEVRVMDGTHIRTNIKSKLIRSGLADIKVTAWKRVAYSGKTHLAPAMLEVPKDGKIMHQQSDAYVRTMFCSEVENELKANGDIKEAQFCRLFREWHEAEDMPGLKAIERCQRSLRLKEWLLEGYEFDSFPTTAMYVKGIPRVTFEGLVCSIDAHLLLYALVKGSCYNWRTVSTLVAENFMGELAERSPNSHGVPSGITLPMEMAKISELHAMRMNPDRSFIMSTAKSRAYEIQSIHQSTLDIKPAQYSLVTSNHKITDIELRDHEFDLRMKKKGKIGKVHKSSEVPRGVQSVRSNYRYDESKAKPSLLEAIPDYELESI